MQGWYGRHLSLVDGGRGVMLPWREKDARDSEHMTIWSIFPGDSTNFEPGSAEFMANLPAVWARWLLGERPAWCEARPGVHYRWEDADLRHLIWHLRRGHGRATLAVLRPRFGTAHAYFGLTDPGPLAARLLELTWMALQHERGHRPEARPAELPVRREAV
jgi:hypothetical protein